jgi:DNA repair exonuclease SbcCD ATPase subunit
VISQLTSSYYANSHWLGWTSKEQEELKEKVRLIDQKRIKALEELFIPLPEYVKLAEKERKEFEAKLEDFNAERRAENARIKQQRHKQQQQKQQQDPLKDPVQRLIFNSLIESTTVVAAQGEGEGPLRC